MTVTDVAREANRPLSTVNSWIAAGHLRATWFQPVGPDGFSFGSPSWFIQRADWLSAKEKCLSLKRGRPCRSQTDEGD